MILGRKIPLTNTQSNDDVLQLIKFYLDKKYKNFSVRIENETLKTYNLTPALVGSLNTDSEMMRMFRSGFFYIEKNQNKSILRFKYTNYISLGFLLLTIIPIILSFVIQPWFIGIIIGGGTIIFSGLIWLGVYGTAVQLMEDAEKAIKLGRDYMMDEIRAINNKT